MTHNMTEMIVTERNTYRKTESAHCHTVDKEMATCTQGVPKVYPRCPQALGRLMSMLRSSLGAAKEQLRSSLEYAYNEILASLRWQASRARATAHSLTRFLRLCGCKRAKLERRLVITVVMMMVLGVTNVWAQTDYSGTYLIKSVSVNQLTAGDYYICPTEGWIYYYTGTNSFTETDNGQPFLTTYQCKTGGYDLRKAVWKIEKSGDYYTIKHVIDGKYMVYNGKISNANEGRIRVHLADVETPGDNELFVIGTNTAGTIAISPKGVSNYFNVCQGNINSLAGSTEYNVKAKNDGPTTPTNHKNDIHGTIGLYKDKDDVNAPFELEVANVCETPTITYDESNGEVSMSTATDGATIYYTTDGTEPTSSSTSYNGTFTVSSTTNFKAIAVKDGKINSMTASKQVVKYTYFIVNSSRNIATQYTTDHPVAAGTPLSGYSSIPADIRSPYIEDETITFKSFDGPFSAAALEAADEIHETPTTENIYITYTVDKLGEKLLHLQGVRPFNLKNGSGQYFVNSSGTTLTFDEVNTETTPNNQNKNKDHIWYISGGDPYAVTITCPATNNYLTSTPSVTNTENTFFIKAEAGTTVTFQDASGSVAVTFNEVNIPTSYYLIDKAGKRLLGPEESTSSAMAIPSEWKSPLATYHYWKSSSFNESDGVYTLKAEQTELSGLEDLGEGDHIYVTYDVKKDIDIQGGKTYLMKFSDGTFFKQENGSDGVNTNATKAIYPYNNGDFNLYVYGLNEDATDKFEQQLSNGASTRTRWLWYLVSNHNGTDLTGDNIDPYHIIVKSRQNQSYKVGDNSYDGNSYMYTYKPNDDVGVVTGVITQHDVVKTLDPTLKPTEYMLLGTDVNHMVLKSVDAIEGAQQIVNKFEQYWKNNPTARNILNDAGKGVGSQPVTYELSNEQKAELTGLETGALQWHTYESWAYAAPWNDSSTGGKTLTKGNHWFQTISMGSGEFSVQEVTLEPEVILLDQHGWEIVRVPMSQKAKLKQYDSPMVETYHWYPTATKVTGYHKYTVSNQEITVYDADGKAVTVEPLTYTHNSTSLADIPYDHAPINNQIAKVKTDFYVTYTVKSDYAGTYVGAATEGAVKASSFFVKQGGKYAQNSSNTIALVDKPALTGEIPTNVQWKVKPNFNIDQEMGYQYDVEEETVDGETKVLNQSEKEALNNKEERNGFDPYNVQIQSVSNTARYFATNTGSTVLDHGIWTGTGSTTVSLREMSGGHISATGYDQRTLDITNATFMVVDDGNGNMRLMPRFDNTKVMTSFTGLSDQLAPAAVGDDGKGTQSLVIELVPTIVSSTDDILSMKGYYILSEDFNLKASIGTSSNPFEGTLDGQLNHYTFDKPIVLYANNAIIRNIILDNIGDLSSGNTEHHLGAIACTAKGNTRIYNCGILAGSLSETGHVGGIVGHLQDYSHVVNCYSYAEIKGGSVVGGVVGYNDYASTAANLHTMVMNCMFYGDITGGSNASPVYGGINIDNRSSENGLNTFNFYAYEKLKSTTIADSKYNCALAVKDEYLNRFEFYRLLLNSNKKLAAYYASTSTTTVQPSDMAKWVLETADRDIATPKPYPVLKAQGRYPSIINYDVEDLPDSASVGRNHGGKLGIKTLSVTISGIGTNAPTGASITTGSLTLTRTDKDFDRFNYNYDKVQLPYYNDVGEGNYTGNRVVTGWKITAITTITGDPYTSANYPSSGVTDYPNHNYADRKSSNKDLYSVSGRIFSQGAYFDVPYGVTSITIEPYWGQAAYVADEKLDVTYKSDYSGKQNLLGAQATNNTTTYPGLDGQTVYTKIGDALGTLKGSTVYDNALVLVGNLHLDNVPSGSGDKAFTIMSVDWDKDNEPDYSMIYHHTGRTVIAPIRFDFLNIPGTAQAQKPNSTGTFKNFTIFKTRGWFETTNTCLVYSNQVEYENKDNVGTKQDAPLILLGGDFEQFVSTQSNTVDGKTTYIHVGSNVRIQSFGLGTHGDGKQSTPHIPVSVTGGEYEGFYLSGTYNQDANVRQNDNAECYISGGHFVEAAGASQEQIDGSVTWQIYDADMDAFYGGGVNAAKPITGDVTVNIFNSHVGVYCGGPKFGDMQTGKKVTTNAEGCTFNLYFGGGFGGTSYSRKKYYDVAGAGSWSNWAGKYTADRGLYFDGKTTNSKEGGTGNDQYGMKGIGVATDVDYEFFAWSSGQTGGRFYVNFASFSLAACNDVESNLKGCTINENFYGGGSYGEVKGKATSVLDGCTVHGNVFGGGFSATLPTVKVRKIPAFTTNPKINNYSGMFEPGVLAGFEETEFSWKRASDFDVTLTNGESGSDMTNHYLYTDVDLTALGKVGSTDLTIKGNTLVEGKIFEYDSNGEVVKDGAGNNVVLETTGGVFGGGDESAVNHHTEVKIQATAEGGVLNVFGGGNKADVVENTTVTITGGTIGNGDASDTNGNVYGGGKGQTTVVGGEVIVNLGTRTGTEAPYTYTGTGLVKHNVYGGSALGSVNTTPNASSEYDKTTTVNIYKGTVNGSVFGGGLGHDDEDDTKDIVAQNFGNTTVTIENSTNANANVKTAVYGGANENGVMKANTTVTITGGTVGTVPTGSDPITNVVFGGGYGEPTLVEGDVEVNIGSEGQASGGAAVNGHVYGGGALGCVNTSKPASDLVFNDTKHTHVNLFKGLIKGNVYGGGLGQQASLEPVKPAIAAYVGGDVQVILDGAQLNCTFTGTGDNRMPLSGQIFGANNLNGTPKGHVKVWVKRTVGTDKSSEAALAKTRDQRGGLEPYSYDVAAVYGGGNQADYIPTNALLTTNPADPSYDAGNPAKVAAATAEVIIDGCEDTSIEYVYGGGNAAAVPATDVTILGSYIIDYVFGGGNGKSTASFTNPGANVGSYNNGATPYGSGKAVTKLVGCHAHYVFGGSNTLGNVREGTSILMPDQSLYPAPDYDCCNVRDVKEIYGAGNEAEQDGNVTLILGCVHNMKNVYGGARNANVKGGIDLVVTSGSFEGVFGGNDQSGTIQGPITVTIEETGCDPLEIDNLYLGGNQAAYSIYGYKNTGTEDAPVLVARTKAEFDELTAEQKTAEGLPYADPVLNVVSCTRIGKTSGEDLGGAFGGGLGNGAVMYGSPTVNVNMIPGKYAKDIDRNGTPGADNNANALGTITNVYGGGKEANVEGNTAVNINTVEKIAHRTNMGAEIPVGDRVQKDVLPAIITNNVFGAGKGRADDVTSALVTGNTTITMGGGSVAKSVYGGGELSQVGGNTNITVRGGEIGDETGANAGETYGNVYGGGKGNTTNVRSGLVKGNTNITIENRVADEDYHTAHPETAVGAVLSSPSIYHNIYGGGAHGSVGTYSYASEAAGAAINGYTSGGAATITITGGTIGVNGHDNGMVFGASRGDVGAPESIYDNVAWVYSTNVVIGTEGQGSNVTSPHIKGSVYGGGENGHVYQNASLTIHSGMVGITDTSIDGGAAYAYRGNVYGGGCGTDKYDNNTKYNPKSGYVGGTASVTIDGGHVVRDVYGAGSMGSVEGNTSVTIAGNAVIGADGSGGGYVFAAARGDAAAPTMATVGSSNLNIQGGTIWMDAYGGGQNGIVKGAVAVSMTGGTVKRDVYGGGALANTNTEYEADGATKETYVTNVTLAGTTINGNLYGGGLGQLAEAGPPAVAAVAANVNGPVTVTVSNGKATNVFGCNNLYGAPQSTVAVNVTGTATVESGSAISNVYGGGNIAAYTGNPTVTVSGGTINNVYGGGLGSTAIVTGNTSVSISGGTIGNDVYGGGSQADVTGSVNVAISGTGTVKHDVYGGGALANTNTGNWNSSTGTWSDTSTGTYYAEVRHLLYQGDEGIDEAKASSVTGFYERSGTNPNYTYTPTGDTKAQKGKTYYKEHSGFLKVAAEGTEFKTTVSLTGGTIGNAYGGGLGRFAVAASGTPGDPGYVAAVSAVEAMVYGDVLVTVGGTKFTQENARVDGKAIPTTGRVFGCNNKNGTPKGSVTVRVQQTKRLDGGNNHVKNQFEIQGVYGGGNMANYVPQTYDEQTEFGQSTHVIIEGCDKTSIERVYGGGNASDVPFSDVVIEGSFQIGYVFGGGNGGDKITKDDGITWEENPGANVPVYTNVLLKGGTIGEAFGGSDSRGTVGSSDLRTQPSGDCDLVINNIYGASKEADFDGNVLLNLSRCSGEVDKVFGGSYNANVRGSVTINITSGIYTSVYGGNDRKGTIGGNITINIEEVDQCNPIIIQNLYGGGSQADYPGTGALTYIGTVPKPDPTTTPTTKPEDYKSFTSGNIAINIKAATRIDRVFGGCDNAKVTGNTTVNINMVKGSMAGNGYTRPASYTGDPIPNMHTSDAYAIVSGLTAGVSDVDAYYTRTGNVYTKASGKAVANTTYYDYLTNISSIDNAIGTIGFVYGGGNQGDVDGNTTVNIGTEVDVAFVNAPAHLTANGSGKYDVLGAHIFGDVFGGGNEGEVTGNTTVNIGTADYSGTANFEGIFVDKNAGGKGGSVYGGGNQADVLGNTNVTMSGGHRTENHDVYVYNGIFGGGYAGSVGTYTRSTAPADVNVYGHVAHAGCIGKPTACTSGGTCTVVVNGGQIGPVDVAKYGMRRADANGGPVPQGWVWGGGCGRIEDPSANPDSHFKTYVNNTDVTIGGTAFILESIIGGGEFGRVLGNTLVKIQDNCQIGVGDGQWETVAGVDKPKRYADADFIDPSTATAEEIEAAAAKLPECSHFPYGNAGQYLPYDPYYAKYPAYVAANPDLGPATTDNASDGKTWIGCVFGGGSGYMPYIKADGSGYDWCRSAGLVEGNTTVQISGGHILTNVYGANEYTDVKRTATVTMTGGTIGVPRTLEQIVNHPLSCYLFGGGKGDQRSHFNQWTDVGSVEVDVSGGIIYGSVFGGAEDGHVIGDASVTIRKGADFTIGSTTYTNGPVIGTWGTSYVDGNIFGGGRGFSGETLTAGNVGGNINVTITGGTILGSIYGGGRLGSVGYDLVSSTDPLYGVMQDGDSHGHVTVEVSDNNGANKTVIGNKYEYQYMTSSVDTNGKTEEQILAERKNELLTKYHVTAPDFSYNGTRYMINHTRGGFVYGGGMGRRELLDGSKNTIVDWTKLGNVKSTKVNIHGDKVWIKGSVFGGGEFGAVTGSHTSLDSKTVGTEVIINGDLTIGSVIGTTNDSYNATLDADNRKQIGDSSDENRYTYGGAYAGGYGTDVDATMSTPVSDVNILGAYVSSNTSIKLQNGAVRSSIYGGGKLACVGGDTYVTVSGGEVGVNQVRSDKYVLFGGMRMGNVYGGGRGSVNSVVTGHVKGNTNVNISGGGIYHNVYGGGALGSVGNFDLSTEENKASYGVMYANVPVNWKGETGTARVTITGGTIGINGHDNGMVNGSSRGDISTNKPASTAVSDPYDHLAWVKNAVVTIGTASEGFDAPQPQIKGSVYGGGENGHNSGNAEVYVHSGTIGVADTNEDTWSNRGSIYGAGCGTDTYEKNTGGTAFTDGYDHHNPMGGRVQGNTTVSIDGGHIIRSVYGAGSMGSVDGDATVTISGGRIGTNGNENNDGITNGDVFGGPKGSLNTDPTDAHAAAHVESTTVTIGYATTPASDDGSTTHLIAGSVYGGGEAGLARGSVTVNMNGGLVKNNLYGGGALANTNTNNWNASANTWADGKTSASNKTTVNLKGGRIMKDVYGGALGRFASTSPALSAIEPKVYGDILVELNKDVETTAKGCVVKRIFGCNDMQGTPMGHVKVHVYATQHANTAVKSTINEKYDKFPKLTGYTTTDYSGLKALADAKHVNVDTYIATLTGSGTDVTDVEKKAALENMEEAVARAVYASYALDLGVSLTDITELEDQREAIADVKYDVQAVYGGGNLAPYVPADALSSDEETKAAARTVVIIDGCELTSIKEVYGSGNAASTPATYVTVNGTHEIDELFGGGNGKDNYQIGTTYYENPGANVGYYNYTTVYKSGDTGYTDVATNGSGTEGDPYKAIDNADASSKDLRINNYSYGYGLAETDVYGGRIHNVYGGSNKKGNIRDMALSVYDDISTCALEIDKTYGAGKNADIDGEIRVQLSCVDYMAELYGGSTAADVNSDVTLTVTNGTFGKVFGGNDRSGTITGSITVNIQESGCRPIIIGELYGVGNEAPYSIYGYNNDKSARTKAEYEAAVATAESNYKNNGHPNATREELDQELMRLNLFGFPKRDPYVNIISATEIGTIYGGGLGAPATVIGSPHVNVNMERGKVLAKYANNEDNSIKEEYTVGEHTDANSNKYTVYSHEAGDDAILEIGTIGDIFGGGNASDIIGNTFVEIGTGTHHNASGELVTISPARNAAFITGSVYGGGSMGHVGDFTKNDSGKPTSCTEGTGVSTVTISNGEIGPNDMKMLHTPALAEEKPDDKGHVFGGGQGSREPSGDNAAYTDNTLVTINGTAWIKGSVYGGSENGHVLHDTHVIIDGNCQIGNGDGVNRRYTAAEWEQGKLIPQPGDPASVSTLAESHTNSLPECASWPYQSPYKSHDMYEGTGGYTTDGAKAASDGHTFYGSVFGGGSGYYPYAAGSWNMKAGVVEGNTKVEIKGGHVLTSVYGGNELTDVGNNTLADGQGKATIRMTGGTIGVPRTLSQIAAHPVTCYLFGAGKGDQAVAFNMNTNVREVDMEVTGGRIYGSVFGGGEDGHVLGDVNMTIGGDVFIGTWGTSYVDGNVFGAGRGFSGDACTAGSVGGNVTMNITGGQMLGSVYGGGRLASVGSYFVPSTHPKYGKLVPDGKNQSLSLVTDAVDNDPVVTAEGATHGHITVNISGSPVIGNDYEYVYIREDESPDLSKIPNTPFDDWTSFTEKQAVDENGLITTTASTKYKRLAHTKGGSVYGGSMGRIYKLDNVTPISNWEKLAHAKSTTVTVTGGTIKSSVYGGSELGQVEGDTHVTFSGGTIGSEVKKTFGEAPNTTDITQYTFGCLYGGGYGTDLLLSETYENPRQYSGMVGGSTTVTMSDGWVKASVFGGGKLATVNGNTTVTVSGGEVGLNKVRKSDGFVMYGSDSQGNVYGGGRGSLVYPLLGVVKGNTNVTVSGGNVYHMVYGGGALASVGNFSLSTGTVPDYIPLKNVPYGWAEGTGTATVNITGGTIGISGRDNGLVFGSSRGNLKKPEADANEGGKLVDPYDRVAWVKNSVVNIGTEGSGSVYTTPLIKGSVYGGGENGHNAEDATVNVYSGTIGIVDKIPGTETADPWWDFGNEDKNTEYRGNRGNVFGAGSGSDTYTGADGKEHYNPKSGMVGHNTVVNIYGGHVGRNVYGGGSMAMVGTLTNINDTTAVDNGGTGTARHIAEASSFALSWPYKFEFANNTGKATVNVTGGHIGTLDTDGGDVYGSSRGEAGDRYTTAHLAYVKDTEVNIDYDSPASESDVPNIKTNFTIPCITGSVHGSGEDGYVYGDTHVTLDKGLIGHSLYGGGKGKGTYAVTLKKIGDDVNTYPAEIYSLIAGKVMGNTYVTMNGGIVGRNVYGGGNMASVGKGNYAGGADDYFPSGYGESLNGNSNDDDRKLWDSSANANSAAFLSSGKTTVKVLGGKVGILTTETKNQLPYGNVFGGSAGEAAPELPASFTTDRYLYCPAFFSGYVNETDVTIGKKRSEFSSDEEYNTYLTNDAPKIAASVYGGGQDGHVRRDTKVTVNNGEIGLDYDADNQEALGTANINDDQWLARGNVYGGGSGITQYTSTLQYKDGTPEAEKIPTTGYSSSSGSVTRFTEVNVLGGIVHRNVYGGGSLGSVGAPDLGQGYDLYKPGQANIDGKPANGPGRQSQCSVKISGQIGTVLNSRSHYGGDVFGACRGTTSLDATQFGTSIWTNVHILNGATIFGNVFGGGDAGIVKKNAEVVIGE